MPTDEELKKLIHEELKDHPVFKALFGDGGRCDASEADPSTITKHAGQFNLKELITKWGHLSFSDANWGEMMKMQVFGDLHSHVEGLRSRELGMLDDWNTHRKNVDARTLLHIPTHDFAFNRTWTFIDELVASLTAKTGVEQDVAISALLTALVDRLVPIVQEQLAKTEAAAKE